MRSDPRDRLFLAALFACAITACAGDELADPPSASVGNDVDAGPKKGRPDAAVSMPDGYDNEVKSEDTYLCGYDDKDVLTLPGNLNLPLASIARSPGGFGLLFYDADGNLRIQAANRTAYKDEPIPVGASTDGLKKARISASGDQYLLVTRAEQDGFQVLRTRSLIGGSGEDVIHTGRLAEGIDDGELWNVTGSSQGYLLAYVDDELHLQRIGPDGKKVGAAVEIGGIAERNPGDLHVVEIDTDTVIVAWSEPQDDGSYLVMGQRLNGALAVTDPVRQLSKNPSSVARIDFSARVLSAGLIYENLDADVRHAIKYRRVEVDGEVPGPVLNVVSAPRKATGGAIADFGQGYAIAYRLLPSLGVPTSEVRVAFINQFGEVVHEAKLADASELGGPVSINSTSDGFVLVSWTTSNGFEAKRTAVKMHCPGALLLCGGDLQ